MSDMKIDPILLSVYARTFKSITDEMSISMEQTTRSPILCEAKDFVTGLYDADGRMLEQTENLPILAFSLAPVCKHISEYFGDDIHPGDVIFHNDVFSPRQPEQRRRGRSSRSSSTASWSPGPRSRATRPTSAARWPAATTRTPTRSGRRRCASRRSRSIERGKLRKDVWDLIFANIRLDIVQHDMKAEIGACTVGERRLLELLRKYGVEQLRGAQGRRCSTRRAR